MIDWNPILVRHYVVLFLFSGHAIFVFWSIYLFIFFADVHDVVVHAENHGRIWWSDLVLEVIAIILWRPIRGPGLTRKVIDGHYFDFSIVHAGATMTEWSHGHGKWCIIWKLPITLKPSQILTSL